MRSYYSRRHNKNPNTQLTLDVLLKLFFTIFSEFEPKGYFQEAFGYVCVDMEKVPGVLGPDISAFILVKMRKEYIWPIRDYYQIYTEDDLFDVIEFLFDVVSAPIEGINDYHSWDNCGWHYSSFDKSKGQSEFITAINEILRDYQSGYELSLNFKAA